MNAKYVNRLIAPTLLVVAGLLAYTSPSDAVVRSARQTGYVEFTIGGSSPFSEYDRLGSFDFVDNNDRPVFVDGRDVFDPTYTLGFAVGGLVNDQYTLGIGFKYTRAELDRFTASRIDDNFRYHLYELTLDMNLYLLPHSKATIAPYVGAGVGLGAFAESAPGLDTQADLVGDFHLNFGADFALVNEASTGGRLTISSINSLTIGTLNDRPKYLTIGAGLRYFLPR